MTTRFLVRQVLPDDVDRWPVIRRGLLRWQYTGIALLEGADGPLDLATVERLTPADVAGLELVIHHVVFAARVADRVGAGPIDLGATTEGQP